MSELCRKISERLDEEGVYAHFEVYENDDAVVVDVKNGDWKHDHWWCDMVMDDLNYSLIDEDIYESDGSDCYSAERTYRRRTTA